MLGPILLTMFVAAGLSALVVAHEPSLAPSPPEVQTTGAKPWPPPGVVRQGLGVVTPRLLNDVKPNYLPMAVKQKVTGFIDMEAVVEIDGTVREVRVTKSLDSKFGQDDEAVATVKKWLFAPGMKDGVVVPVLIEVRMSFTLR
jgi:periplasmic protein TonB